MTDHSLSELSYPDAFIQTSSQSLSPPSFFDAAVNCFKAWLGRRRTFAALRHLSDHHLRDVGLSRQDLPQEIQGISAPGREPYFSIGTAQSGRSRHWD